MGVKLKNAKKAKARGNEFLSEVHDNPTQPAKNKTPANQALTPAIEEVTATARTFVIPDSVKSTVESFSQLKELAYLVERHYDRYTDSEEKATLNKLLNNLTELNVSNLTVQLNDVQKAQAAMLIRQIIKDHLLLERVHLQDNNFAPPDLQFIIKALMYVFYEPVKKYKMSQVNMGNSVTAANLERSSAELMQLRKAYGNNIAFDAPVYDYFIEKYLKATNHYLLYLSKKFILPKTGSEITGKEGDIETAAAAIKQGLPNGTKYRIHFDTAVKKYNALSELRDILTSKTKTSEIFEKFQTLYKTSKKALAKLINKDDTAHLDRFHEHIGDVKPQVFNPTRKNSNSIFKPEPKKKKKSAKKAKASKRPKKASAVQF
jgi:hypothetical protein